MEVNRALGPGLLESAYRQWLCHELQLRGVPFVCERQLPVTYKGLRLDCGHRVDLIIAEAVVVEYTVLPPVTSPAEALAEGAPRLHPKGNLLSTSSQEGARQLPGARRSASVSSTKVSSLY